MKMEGIELYPHNQKAYDNLCAMLRDSNRACVVQPTGTGKFVIIAKMAQDNPGKNFLLLGTNDYMHIDQMANLSDIAPGFTPKNLQFMTYATAMAKARCGDEIPRCDIEKVREKKKYSKFVKKYEELRRSLQDADGIDRIIAKHLRKRDSKVIVFCPNQKKLQEFMLLRREWFGRVNKEVHAYKTTSADPYGSRDFQEFKEDSSSALKVLYCINQLNEAVHVKGIDAIVMVRPTKSPVIFQQQLGRALTSGGNRTPLVFDLCNNFGSLGGIAGMQERMERAYEKKSEQGEKPIYEPKDFHVIDEIKDPRELAEELREALNPSTTIDEKISFLEEIAAQNGGQL